jgi:DNA primase
MAIEEESIQTLKNRLDIVDVVGRYIELKKDGAGFKANCPFHDENTASFKVSPSKQICHCFGCGAGGDSIKFVMDYENLSYPEAIEKLASEYNIQLKYTNNGYKKERDDKRVLEELNLFFRKQLLEYKDAKEYFLSRGVYESSIEKFELGYAPESKKSLDFLREKGVKLKEGLDLGVLAQNEDGRVYARFTNRITFPIFTPGGKIVGFGGRIITQRTDIGKYINSPETRFFDKSSLLYGYHKARNTIMKKGRIIVVEGNLDVVMLHQAGWTNTVATLGTAFTEKIIPLLRRGNPEIILAYDGDRAGLEAAFKAATMLSVRGMRGGVVIFERGVDPADMVKDGKTEELKKLFNTSQNFIEFCLTQISSKFDKSDAMQKELALKESLSYLSKLSPIIQDEYKAYLSATLNISQRHIKIQQAPRQTFNPSDEVTNKKEDIAELSIIKTLLSNPQMIDKLLDVISIDIFNTHQQEFELLIGNEVQNPLLVGISMRDDILEYENDELDEQIRFLLRRHYNTMLLKIRHKSDLSIEQKSFYIRKIRDIISRLQKGEMVAYESFSTI